MKEQPKTAKEIVLTTAISSCIATVLVYVSQIIFPFSKPPTPRGSFNSVECKRLSVVDDDGKTGMLLTVSKDGGLLTLYGNGPDYRRIADLSIRKSGGMLILDVPKGMISIAAGDGIHLYHRDGNTRSIRTISATPESEKTPDELDENSK